MPSDRTYFKLCSALLTASISSLALACATESEPPPASQDGSSETEATDANASADSPSNDETDGETGDEPAPSDLPDPEPDPEPDPDPEPTAASYEPCEADTDCPEDHLCAPAFEGGAKQCRAMCSMPEDCPDSGMDDLEFPPLTWCADDGMCKIWCSEVALIPALCAEGWTCAKPLGKKDGACEQLP